MNKWLVIAIVVLLVVAGALWMLRTAPPPPPPEPDTSTRVTTTEGEVVGYVSVTGAHAWQGIPFAAAPVGELRWRAPRPPQPRASELIAVSPGSACIQPPNVLVEDLDGDGVAGSEDCLYLNVYAPAGKSSPLKPVMFWIHGGGNTTGEAGMYDGSILAARYDVVVVAANYRLGPFGWFSHAALRHDRADPTDRSANFGTSDTVAALRWVQANIAAFGGDPGNVTVFGESAGGTNTFAMMASPNAEGLFHRAIVQSGGPRMATVSEAENFAGDSPAGHDQSANEVIATLLVHTGAAAQIEEARTMVRNLPDEAVQELLYEAEAGELLRLYGGGGGFGMLAMPTVVGDGLVLPAAETMMALQLHNRVPVILGTNRDEAKLFMAMNPQRVERRFGFLPRIKDLEAYNRDAAYASDAWKIRGVDGPARTMVARGHDDVWAYRFDWDEQTTRFGFDLSEALGAAHALEISFIFGGFDASEDALGQMYDPDRVPARGALSDTMSSYWAEFAYNGDPGRGRNGDLPLWGRWQQGADDDKMIIFDTPADGGVRMSSFEMTYDLLKERLQADDGLATQADRCALYERMFRGSPAWDDAEYASLGEGGCPADAERPVENA